MRTRVYIDGYNLYYGCLKGTAFKWLDLLALFARHVLPSVTVSGQDQALTSRRAASHRGTTAPMLEQAAKTSDSLRCQGRYHAALSKHQPGRIDIIKGYYSLTQARPKAIDPVDPQEVAQGLYGRVPVWRSSRKSKAMSIWPCMLSRML